jgi:hypothetical protein
MKDCHQTQVWSALGSLKLEPGEKIKITAEDFERLTNAFFTELESEFLES